MRGSRLKKVEARKKHYHKMGVKRLQMPKVLIAGRLFAPKEK